MNDATTINLSDAAATLGYDSISWSDEHDCYVGFGSSNPCDRSNDGDGQLVARSDKELAQRLE